MMGKRNTIKRMVAALLRDGEYGQYVALLDMVKRRRLDRDVLFLISIFKDNVGKRNIMGEYYLLCVIKENAKETTAKAIVELLFLPEIYIENSRGTRCLLLEMLGDIGDCRTVENIKESIPLFESVKYVEMDGVDAPKRRREYDMKNIGAAIKKIATRKGC